MTDHICSECRKAKEYREKARKLARAVHDAELQSAADNWAARKLVLYESITIWHYMKRHGINKGDALETLYRQGMISQRSYTFGCPLCHLYYKFVKCTRTKVLIGCPDCPWPRYTEEQGRGHARCETHPSSPYYKHINCKSPAEFKRTAEEIYLLLIEMLVKEA